MIWPCGSRNRGGAAQGICALLWIIPPQRLAREAMFFLVWSCPDPVIDCTVSLLDGKQIEKNKIGRTAEG